MVVVVVADGTVVVIAVDDTVCCLLTYVMPSLQCYQRFHVRGFSYRW